MLGAQMEFCQRRTAGASTASQSVRRLLRVYDRGFVKETLADNAAPRKPEAAFTRHDDAQADRVSGHRERAAGEDRFARLQRRIKRDLAFLRTRVVAVASAIPHIGDDEALALRDASSAAREAKRHVIDVAGAGPRVCNGGDRDAPVV